MPRKHDKYVKPVRSKGRLYLYFDTGQNDERKRRIYTRLPDPSDKFAYGTAYGNALAARSRRANHEADESQITVPVMIDLWQKSAAYRKLKPGTQRVYNIYLAKVAAMLPTAPAGDLTSSDVILLMDRLGETPGAANLMVGAIGGLYKWARGRHVPRECRPTFGVPLNELDEHDPWPEHVVEAALTCDDPDVRLGTHLLYFTAQRIGDVLKMRWSDIRDGFIHQIVQQKTEIELSFPVHVRLAKELERTPRTGLTIIAGAKGRKRSQEWLRVKLQTFAEGYGVEVVPHGLRKNAVNALLECGCSTAETAAISGQSLQLVEFYAKKRDRKKLGSAAMLKWNKA